MANEIKLGITVIEKEVLKLIQTSQFVVMDPARQQDWATKQLKTATMTLLNAIANARKINGSAASGV
jgi:hypothetical protein